MYFPLVTLHLASALFLIVARALFNFVLDGLHFAGALFICDVVALHLAWILFNCG